MTITSREDQALLDAHHAGDPEAFAEIVASYRVGLLSHAQRRLRDPDAARDAVQETFLRAYRAIDRFGGEQLLGAWLHRIMDNVCNDEAMRRHREQLLLQRVGVPMAAHDDDITIVDSSVETALASLPSSYRESLVLRAIDDLSFRELAARTGVTEENARARFHRARTMFRSIFDGSAAVLMPVAAFISKPLSRFRAGNGVSNQALGAQPVVSPQVSSFLASSPGTVHVLNEIAQPERVTTLAKVVFTIAAAVPVVAVATPSSGPIAPPAAQVVQAVDAGSEPDSSSDTQSTSVPASLPSTTVAGPDAALAVASTTSTSSTSTTSTTVASNALSSRTVVAPPATSSDSTTDTTESDGTNADTATTSDAGTTAGSTTTTPPPPAHASNAGHVSGTLDRDQTRSGFVYRGAVDLTVGSASVPGWLGCSVTPADSSSTGTASSDTLQCWFFADDGNLDLSLTAHRQPVTSPDGRQIETYQGAWQVTSGDPGSMPQDGVASVDLEVGADKAIIDLWLDPAVS